MSIPSWQCNLKYLVSNWSPNRQCQKSKAQRWHTLSQWSLSLLAETAWHTGWHQAGATSGRYHSRLESVEQVADAPAVSTVAGRFPLSCTCDSRASTGHSCTGASGASTYTSRGRLPCVHHQSVHVHALVLTAAVAAQLHFGWITHSTSAVQQLVYLCVSSCTRGFANLFVTSCLCRFHQRRGACERIASVVA